MSFTVYSKEGCPYCSAIIQVLVGKDFQFTEYKLNEDFIFSDNTTIVGFEISSNKLIFDLSQTPSNNVKLSFIGFFSNVDAISTHF